MTHNFETNAYLHLHSRIMHSPKSFVGFSCAIQTDTHGTAHNIKRLSLINNSMTLLSTSIEAELNTSLNGVDDKELDSRLSDADLERRQLQMENEALLTELDDAHKRIRILQIKNLLASASIKKRRGIRDVLPRFNGLFRRRDEKQEPSTPATQAMDAYSVIAVCDTNDIGDECLQLEFMPLTIPTSTGMPQSLAEKYLNSSASDTSCALTETSSQAEF